MYDCPACGATNVTGRGECDCGADLTLLERLDAMADVWFNEARASLAAGAAGRALEWLSASCAARPTDAAARRAQAKVWAQLGRWDEARDALDRAALLDPDAEELAAIRAALQESPGANRRDAAKAAKTKLKRGKRISGKRR